MSWETAIETTANFHPRSSAGADENASASGQICITPIYHVLVFVIISAVWRSSVASPPVPRG